MQTFFEVMINFCSFGIVEYSDLYPNCNRQERKFPVTYYYTNTICQTILIVDN